MNGQPIAYAYEADLYCPECMANVAIAFGASPLGGPEAVIASWAELAKVDHMDEGSYDSGDFPKASFHAEDIEHCGRCGDCISHDWHDCHEEDNDA